MSALRLGFHLGKHETGVAEGRASVGMYFFFLSKTKEINTFGKITIKELAFYLRNIISGIEL